MFVRRRHVVTAGVGGAALAAGLFAAGLFAGYALDDSGGGNDHTATALTTGATDPGKGPLHPNEASGAATPAGSNPAISIAPAPPVSGGMGGGPAGRDMGVGCPAPLEGALAGGKLDGGLGGFPAGLLGDGFVLSGFGLSAQRLNCEPGGAVVRVFQSSWTHSPSQATLQVSQAEAKERTTNLITPYMATFWRDGYTFTVYAGGPVFTTDMPAGPVLRDDAGNAGSAGSGSSSSGVASPAKSSPGVADFSAAIEAAVKQLAGGIDSSCFYRQENGTWEDAVAAGIGEARAAIPSRYSAQGFQFMKLTVPAADCGVPALDPGWGAVNLQARFADSSGHMIYLNAFEQQGGQQPAGFNTGYATWSNGRFAFSLNWPPEDVTDAEARAIASALDPGFAKVCLPTMREMTDGEFAALGLRAPAPPENFALEPAPRRVVLDFTGNCSTTPGNGKSFDAEWTISDGRGSFMNATVTSGVREQGMTSPSMFNAESGLHWQDARAYDYYVSSFKVPVDRQTLLQVAHSFDPAFDESKLTPAPTLTPPDAAPASKPGGAPTR